jgi:hypothetical protein
VKEETMAKLSRKKLLLNFFNDSLTTEEIEHLMELMPDAYPVVYIIFDILRKLELDGDDIRGASINDDQHISITTTKDIAKSIAKYNDTSHLYSADVYTLKISRSSNILFITGKRA